MSEQRYEKPDKQPVQPKIGAASDQGTGPANSLSAPNAPKSAARGPEELAEPGETAARPATEPETEPEKRVVVISGPGLTNKKGFADLERDDLIRRMSTDADWEVRTADQQSQASLPDDAAIVYFGREPEFNLADLEARPAVIFVRDLGWTSFEPKYRDLKMGGLLSEKLQETVKFVSNGKAAAEELLKMDTERSSVAEGSPQAAQQHRKDLQTGRLAGRPEATTPPPQHVGRQRGIEPNSLEQGM